MIGQLDYPGARLLMEANSEVEKQWRLHACAKEPWTVKFVEAARGQFVDAGANVGSYTLIAVSRGLSVVAIEPAFPNYAALCGNLVRNSFVDGIRRRSFLEAVLVCPVLLGSTHGLSWLHYSDLNAGAASHVVTQTGEYPGDPSFHRQLIPSVPLDAILGTIPAEHRWVKVDVDGAEAAVLEGATTTLDDPATEAWLIEVKPKETEAPVCAIMEAHGWRMVERYDRGGKGGVAYTEWRRDGV